MQQKRRGGLRNLNDPVFPLHRSLPREDAVRRKGDKHAECGNRGPFGKIERLGEMEGRFRDEPVGQAGADSFPRAPKTAFRAVLHRAEQDRAKLLPGRRLVRGVTERGGERTEEALQAGLTLYKKSAGGTGGYVPFNHLSGAGTEFSASIRTYCPAYPPAFRNV